MEFSDRIPLNAEVPIPVIHKWVKVWKDNEPTYRMMDESVSNMLNANKGKSELELMTCVNRWVNMNIRYQFDPGDNWQAPSETANLESGDCEDIAMLKLDLLDWLGIKTDRMDVWFVHVRQSPQDHAILVIDDHIVLDSRSDSVHQLKELLPYYEPLSCIGRRGYKGLATPVIPGGQDVPSV